MLKLRRCHLSCIGNRSARFSPVSLDFSKDESAENSVVFLENGGGKTTLAAFLYLTLWPEQNHFLLKAAKNPKARVANYLSPGQTAYIVLECETRVAGLLDEPVVRVIGQVLKRRDATEQSPVDRHFFTFLPRPGITFDDLPIHGINGQASSLSYDDFRAWLRERQGQFAGAELWEGSSVEEYIKKLREIHAEPELIRVQIDLNKREGGIDDHFKEHCADSRKFVHTFLDLALQSAKGDETVGVLGRFLAEWQNVGHLEEETTFCDEFVASLATLADAHDRWCRSHKKLRDCQQVAAGLWQSLNRRVDELNQQRVQTAQDLREAKSQALKAKQDVDNSYHHTISYELEWLELRAREAAQAASDADGKYKDAERADRLTKLARALGEIERSRRDLEAKRRVLAEKQAELAPLFAKLNSLGAAFAQRLGDEATRLEAESGAANGLLKTEQDRDTSFEKSRQDLAVETSQHQRTLNDVKSFFDHRRNQRDKLGEKGLLEPNERAEDGRVRWDTKRQSEEANIVEQRQRQRQLTQRLTELNDEHARIKGEAATAQGEVKQLQTRVDEAQQERAYIATHDLVLSHFGDQFDPLRHGVEEDVMRKQADVFHVLLNLRLDLATLQRNREGIEQYHVLPPPRDVESVLERLQQAGVEASPGLRYLADTCNCDEAERVIRADPARYAGVLVSSKHWEKLATLAWPEVSQPVSVSTYPDKFSIVESTERRIVVPTRAAFDKAEASRRSLHLEDEQSTTQSQLDERRTEYDGLGHVLTKLRAFVGKCGDGKLAALERDLQAKQRHAQALQAHIEQLKQQIGETTAERDAASNSEQTSRDSLQTTIQPALNAIERFITDMESKIDEMRGRETAAQDRLIAIAGEAKLLDGQRETCKQAIATIQQRVFDIREQLKQARNELNGIHHRDAAVDANLVAQPVDMLRASYHEQRQFYEGKQDLQAQVEIKAAEQVVASMQRNFLSQLNDIRQPEVDSLAKQCDFAEVKLRELAETAAATLAQAINNRARKEAESEAAKNESNDKERKAPEAGKRRYPEGETRPRTSADAAVLLERGREFHSQRQMRKQEIDEKVSALNQTVGTLERQAVEHEGQRNLLERFKDGEAAFVELSKDFAETRAAVATAREDEKAASADEQRIRNERGGKLKTARDVTTNERFGGKVSLAKRFEAYTDDSLLSDLTQIRNDLDQRITSNRDRLAGLKQTREQLVHMMNGLADEILALLKSIEKVSRLPEEGMGVWSGKPFIKMSFYQPDDAERQVALRGLLEELIELRRSRNNEAPETDSSGLMRLIVDRLVCDKRVHVQILKPTPVRADTYEDVEMLRHYSGGEGVTVAILMYLTIVQLRAQNVQSSRRLQDAGFLLLDNPFGKCNREDLVRMQVQLAEQLRVQLVVLTGLREPVIMMSYPRRVRLVNDMVNRVTGAKHVRVDGDGDGNITAVENLRRFSFNGS
jgi:outer membrane murein-binding lipoprotein Lpp